MARKRVDGHQLFSAGMLGFAAGYGLVLLLQRFKLSARTVAIGTTAAGGALALMGRGQVRAAGGGVAAVGALHLARLWLDEAEARKKAAAEKKTAEKAEPPTLPSPRDAGGGRRERVRPRGPSVRVTDRPDSAHVGGGDGGKGGEGVACSTNEDGSCGEARRSP